MFDYSIFLYIFFNYYNKVKILNFKTKKTNKICKQIKNN